VVKDLVYKINFTCIEKHTKKYSTRIESRRWRRNRDLPTEEAEHSELLGWRTDNNSVNCVKKLPSIQWNYFVICP